jgi:hypothetical protein
MKRHEPSYLALETNIHRSRNYSLGYSYLSLILKFHLRMVVDPFGATGLVVQVLGILTTLISIIDSIKKAPRDAVDIGNELESLRAVIQTLKTTASGMRHGPPKEWMETANTVLAKVETTGNRLHRTINAGLGRTMLVRRVTWVLEKQEATEYCVQLRSYVQMLNTLQGSIHW